MIMGKHPDETVSRNLEKVKKKIVKIANQAGRDPDSIKLVVVTKTKSAVVVKKLGEHGVQHIGESYLDEASFKIDLLADLELEWHMIGHIQTGKARKIAYLFDYVHSLDRLSLAEKLDQGAEEAGKILPAFIECNVSGEKTKQGWEAWDEKEWGSLAANLKPVLNLDNLKIKGLMTMAPYFEDPERARPIFNRLARLAEFLDTHFKRDIFSELSMGMSADYQVAIEEGATYLRIGSEIVGPRE